MGKEIENVRKLSFPVAHQKLKVPYAMLQYVVKERKFNAFQTMLAGKFLYSNTFSDPDLIKITQLTEKNIKTIRTHLRWLIKHKWLGYDVRKKIYINRGFHYIRRRIGDNGSAGYSLDISRLREFKAFAIASVYDQLISGQQYRRWKQSRERNEKGTSTQTGLLSKGYYPVANGALASIFDISESTASRYRKIASAAGFIEVKEALETLPVDIANGLDHRIIKKYAEDQMIYRNKGYYIQGITHVRSKMIRNRRSFFGREKTASIWKGDM